MICSSNVFFINNPYSDPKLKLRPGPDPPKNRKISDPQHWKYCQLNTKQRYHGMLTTIVVPAFFFSPQMEQTLTNGFSLLTSLLETPWIPNARFIKGYWS
jgi:hypothetical protein